MRHINNLARTKGLNSRMKGEVLLIDGKRYTDLASLPHGPNLADAKTLSINNGIAFEGPESYMSNLYPCKLIIYGVECNSAEQAFCHLKATVNKQPAAAVKILATTDPLTAKLIVKGVKVSEEWTRNRLKVLEKVVKTKFEQNPSLLAKLKSTGDTPLYEATRDTFYGCGLTLMQSTSIDSSCPGQTQLGKILQKIRGDL